MRRLPLILLSLALGAAPADAQTPQPIVGAGDWKILHRLPGMSNRVCSIRIDGPEADTIVLLNRDNVPVLAAGRADWSGLLGDADASLSIDGTAPLRLKMVLVNNLAMMLLSDAQLLHRLRAARTLDWSFPFGRYRANVAGMGAALDALTACAARLSSQGRAPSKS